MNDITVSPQFCLAGEATFTVSNGSGKHYTYHIYRAEPTAQYPNPAWFIKVLSGPDNYTYMGKLVYDPHLPDRTPIIKMTGRSHYKADGPIVKVAQWALRAIWQVAYKGYQLPAGMSIKHEGKCGRCGRALTHPASLTTGLGPECADMLGVLWSEPTKISGGLF